MAKKKTPKSEGKIPPPSCKALLLCERVLFDRISNQCSAINIIDCFYVSSFPGDTIPFFIYMQLMPGIGKYSVVLEIRDLANDNVRARANLEDIEFTSRLGKMHFISLVPPMSLEHPGLYDFVVLADGQEIDRQQFLALQLKENEHEQDEAEDSGEE